MTRQVDYCNPIFNFDFNQCVQSKLYLLPWWVEWVWWIAVALFVLSIVERLMWVFELLFLPGLKLLWELGVALSKWHP